MKIKRVFADNRKKAFLIETKNGTYEFPYSQLRRKPTPNNTISYVGIERELGQEAFTYRLVSGAEDTVHIDHVLHYNQDPTYLREQLLYNLSLRAQELIAARKITRRHLARKLQTSPTQLYRLLDQTYYGKTIDQMVKLLHSLGQEVEFVLKDVA